MIIFSLRRFFFLLEILVDWQHCSSVQALIIPWKSIHDNLLSCSLPLQQKSLSAVAKGESIDGVEESTFSCSIPQKLSREKGQQVMDEIILPSKEFGKRMRYGGDAQGLQASTIIAANDPRNFFTYGEFPMTSLDELVDLGLSHYDKYHRQSHDKKDFTMIDLGSGCGRLVLYSALTRGNLDNKDDNYQQKMHEDVSWSIHGIEISNVLHDEALRACLTGLDNGFIDLLENSSLSSLTPTKNSFTLHLGPAQDFGRLFQQADIVFMYSTVFETAGFSPELSALIMSQTWNELLSNACRPGTIVISTDRALDPAYGWKLLDRLDVDNREVMGSTGYIQIYQP